MPKVFTEELRRIASFLMSEAEHFRSRDVGQVLPGDGVTYLSGLVLGKKTSDGNYVEWDPDAVDGTEVVAGILYEECTGVGSATVERTIVTRDAQVKSGMLGYLAGADAGDITAAATGLAALGIIVRTTEGTS